MVVVIVVTVVKVVTVVVLTAWYQHNDGAVLQANGAFVSSHFLSPYGVSVQGFHRRTPLLGCHH